MSNRNNTSDKALDRGFQYFITGEMILCGFTIIFMILLLYNNPEVNSIYLLVYAIAFFGGWSVIHLILNLYILVPIIDISMKARDAANKGFRSANIEDKEPPCPDRHFEEERENKIN